MPDTMQAIANYPFQDPAFPYWWGFVTLLGTIFLMYLRMRIS
jgi:hypothetical protein